MKRAYFWIGWIGVAILFSSFCYLYGLMHSPDQAVYTGIRPINASDYNQHLSWIDQMRRGKFFLNNLYTSEPHPGMMVRPVYFFLSLPFGITSISNSVVFHILRVACGLLLLCLLPTILRIFEKEERVIKICFLLLAFSSGAGLLLQRWIPHPADFSIPETLLFLSLGEAPHFSFSLLLFWFGAAFLYLSDRLPLKSIAGFLICLFVLWWDHPFDAVSLIALAILNLVRLPGRKHQGLVLIGIAFVSVPPFLFYQTLKETPAFSGWGTQQGLMLSPSLPAMLSAFLPLILFAVFGISTLKQEENRKKLLYFLLGWICLQFVLTYVPFFSFQRRLIAGIQLPFAILAAHGLNRLRKPALIGFLIAVASAGSFFITWQQVEQIKTGGMPYYQPVSYRKAFDWLQTQPKSRGAVLSGFVTGNFIPAYTGLPVYIGHSFVTPDSAEKKEKMVAFYRGSLSDEFLIANHIQYVFYGLEERRVSPQFPLPQLSEIYKNEDVTIFSVAR